MHSQCTDFMKVPELEEFLRHGMETRVGQDVVVVVVADRLLMHIHGEGPEAIDGHFLAEAQGRAHQEESCRQALGVDSPVFPELPNATQEVGVGKEHCLIGTDIGQCVINPEGWLGPCLHGKGRHVDIAVVIDFHVVHKCLSGPQQVLKPLPDDAGVGCH